jgi:flagellar biosynthesis/type III secretory pathway protein FliH
MRTIKVLNMDAIGAGPVIRGDTLAQLVQASTIIEEAEKWAEQQRATMTAEIETARLNAFASAYSEWLKKHADALTHYTAKTNALEGRVMDFVRMGLVRILTKLPSEQVLYSLVAPVLSELKSSGEIVIMVHANAMIAARQMASSLQKELTGEITLVVRADASLGPDDCLVYTDEEVFNVSIPVTCDLFCRALTDLLKAEARNVV